MPCRHHWHLDGFGTMRAQWRPVAGSLPYWASQWSVSYTESGCSLGRRKRGEEWDRVSKRDVGVCVHVCLFAFPWCCGVRQWQLMAKICAAKPNRQTTVIACLISAVERPGVMMATQWIHLSYQPNWCFRLPSYPAAVTSPFHCLDPRNCSEKWRKYVVERNMSALDTWLAHSRHCVNTNQQL